MDTQVKSPLQIAHRLNLAETWVRRAHTMLEFSLDKSFLRDAKISAQRAKKLLDEAVVDIDGLIQDEEKRN